MRISKSSKDRSNAPSTETSSAQVAMQFSTLRPMLGVPLLVLVLTILAVAYTGKLGWFSVGGSVISAVGTKYWAWRLLRLKPGDIDDQLPPEDLIGPRSRFPIRAVSHARMIADGRRAYDNLRSYVGVWVSIAGGIIASAVPFLMHLVWPALYQ
jgi:uncharacterized protein (DUF697 family)